MDLTRLDNETRTVAIHRLTALWAFNEAGLGGILHALQLPFKGIIIGGIAVILISMIGFLSEDKSRSVIKATLIVLIIKLMVAPFTPLTAYLAVSFQGLTGALLFRYLRNFRLASLLLALLSFAESSLQRLLVLTLIFGNPLWESVDAFAGYILTETRILAEGDKINASAWVITIYLSIYLIGALVTGIFAGNLPGKLMGFSTASNNGPEWNVPPPEDWKTEKKDRPWWRAKKMGFLVILVFVTLTLFLISPDRGWSRSLYVIVRSLLMIGIWYLVIAPLVLRWFNRYLNRQRSKYSEDVERVLLSFPAIRESAASAWGRSSVKRGPGRIGAFIVLMIGEVLWQRQ